MDKIIQYGNFTPIGKHKNKKQIILCHTSRDVEEYLTSLKFRYNKKYDKIPHFVISRTGKILQLLPENTFSNFFDFTYMNKNSVIICLENLGWMEKKPLTNHHINWKGSIYNEPPYEKKWRDYFFWQPYTETQIDNLGLLCKELFKSIKIKPHIVEHNIKISGIEKYCGIVTKSNFGVDYTDVSPAFKFNELDDAIAAF
jgi:N-acetyl-anhydromuramyl-L-alanine amidase AmpD